MFLWRRLWDQIWDVPTQEIRSSTREMISQLSELTFLPCLSLLETLLTIIDNFSNKCQIKIGNHCVFLQVWNSTIYNNNNRTLLCAKTGLLDRESVHCFTWKLRNFLVFLLPVKYPIWDLTVGYYWARPGGTARQARPGRDDLQSPWTYLGSTTLLYSTPLHHSPQSTVHLGIWKSQINKI